MDNLGTYLNTNKTSTLWSFSFRITGLPYNWTDGRATWGDSTFIDERPGCLVTDSYALKFIQNPLEPTQVGDGLKIKLIDDATAHLRQCFAPLYGDTTRMSALLDNGSSDTTMYVQDNSAFSVDDYLYLGSSETVKVTGKTSTDQIAVARAQFGTLRHRHNTNQAPNGPIVSSSPRTFAGRYGELWMGNIHPITGALVDTYMIWAGRVDDTSNIGTDYTVSMSSLEAAIKAFWPKSMPEGSLHDIGEGGVNGYFYLSENDYFVKVSYTALFTTTTTTTVTLGLGLYDSSGTFTQVTAADGQVTYTQVLKMLQDTIIYGSNEIDRSELSVVTDINNFYYSNRSDQRIEVDPNHAFGAVLASRGLYCRFEPYTVMGVFGTGEVFVYGNSSVGKTDTQITTKLTDVQRPFSAEQGYGNTNGYAVISSGSKTEVIEFSGVEVDSVDPRICKLTGCMRGRGGTAAQDWSRDDASDGPIKITQIAAYGPIGGIGTFGDLVNVLTLSILTSTGDNAQNGAYDQYGDLVGLAIPLRYVDYQSVLGISDTDLMPVNLFWVDKPGKGQKDLKELLKAAGLTLKTRRYSRGGENLFGLSMESILLPSNTTYTATMGDSDALAKKRPMVNYNEKLLVNTTKFSSRLNYDESGRDFYYYDENSISDYGTADLVDFDVHALLGAGRVRDNGGWPNSVDELNFQEAGYIALRWFSSYGQGNYTIRVDAPLPACRFQVGDRVLLTLTGIDNIDGSDGVSEVVGKVIEASYTFGSSPRVQLKFRLSYSPANDLVPCALVTARTGAVLTLAANEFSTSNSPSPFASTATCADVLWFDRSRASADIPVFIYDAEDPDVYDDTLSINATSVSANQVRLDGTPNAGIQASITAGNRVILSYGQYDDLNTVTPMNAFAYSNDNANSLGKEWV